MQYILFFFVLSFYFFYMCMFMPIETHKHKCLHAFVGIINAWRCVTSRPHCEALSRATTARRYLIWTSCKPTVTLNKLINNCSFSFYELHKFFCELYDDIKRWYTTFVKIFKILALTNYLFFNLEFSREEDIQALLITKYHTIFYISKNSEKEIWQHF